MATIEKRAFSGSIANALLFVFSFVQSIVLVPVFLHNWGAEKYGIWIAIYTFFALIKTMDLGHLSYVGNEITKFYHTDITKAKTILASSLKISYFIGFLEFLAGVGLLYFFGGFFLGMSKDSAQFNQAFFGVISLLIMWLAIGTVGGIWVRLLVTTGQFTRATYWGLAFKILETITLLATAFYNLSILITCISMAGVTLLYSIICIWDIKKKLIGFDQLGKYASLKLGWTNFKKSIILTFSGFMEQFGNNVQIAGVNYYLGGGLLPSYTTVKTITNIAVQVINIFTGPITIDVVRLYVNNEKEKLVELFSVTWLAALIFIYIPFIVFTPFVKNIYTFWTHNMLPFNETLFYLLALSVCVISFGTPFKLLLTGVNHLRSLTIISATRLLVLCIIPLGIMSMGLTMVGLAVLLSELLASAIVPYFFVRREFRQMGGAVPGKLLLVSVIPLLIIAAFFAANLLYAKIHIVVVLIFFAAMLLTLVWHWKILKDITRNKIIGTFSAKLKAKKTVL